MGWTSWKKTVGMTPLQAITDDHRGCNILLGAQTPEAVLLAVV
jgi:hypothetical protein